MTDDKFCFITWQGAVKVPGSWINDMDWSAAAYSTLVVTCCENGAVKLFDMRTREYTHKIYSIIIYYLTN